MYHAMAREARFGRSKAREVSRKLGRIHRGAREELSKAESTTLWLLGGVAVLGGGYLAYRSMTQTAAAAVPPAGTAPSTPSTPSSTPSTPSTPSSTAKVTWASTDAPWAPPSNPAALPPGFGLTDDLTTQDPMWIAMAQSALNIISRVQGSTPVTVSYAGTPNGVSDTSFMIAMTQVQGVLATTVNQMKATNSALSFISSPHTNGILDLKTMAFLIMTSSVVAAETSGSTVLGTVISDPILSQEAVTALTNAVNSAATLYAQVLPGITVPISLSTALTQFQKNWDTPTQALQVPASGNLDWVTWGLIVTMAG